MKRILILILMLTLVCAMGGCKKEEPTDYYMHGYEAVNEGLYEDALYYFDLAARKGDDQAKKAYDIVDTYLRAKDAMESKDLAQAKSTLEGIPEDYKYYGIAKDVDALKKQIESQLAVDQELASIYVLIQEEKYDQALSRLAALPSASLTEEQQKTVASYQKTIKENEFTQEMAVKYITSVYNIVGDLGEGLTPSYDEQGNKYYEVTVQHGDGEDATIATLRVFADGTIEEV